MTSAHVCVIDLLLTFALLLSFFFAHDTVARSMSFGGGRNISAERSDVDKHKEENNERNQADQ